MFIIYSNQWRGKPLHYFCGIFQEGKKAQDYLETFPAELKKSCRIQEFPEFQDYPLYLIEWDFNKSPAVPITLEQLAQEIAKVPKVADDDYVYFNYYRFLSDYYGIVPGEDNTGATDHHHLDNELVKWLVHAGIQNQEKWAKEVYGKS